MKDFLISLLDWIYKKKCYFCGKSNESVKMCSKCFDELEFLPAEINRTFNKVNIYCAGVYSKYLQKLGIEGDFQIVPVPIFLKRKKQRKYNHMELVAEEFSKLSGFDVNFNLIKRIKDTKPQYKLNKTQRMMNLSKAFEIDKNKFINGKKILIIDDICTTGATFEEMIKEFNASNIYDLTCFATTTPFD